MERVSWTPLTALHKDAIGDRLRSGLTAKPAARELGLPAATVRSYLARCGGIRPAPRTRSAMRLTLAEREEISRGLAAGLSMRAIAAGLGRAPSTIGREVSAHGGRRGYRALAADQAAWKLATRPKLCRSAGNFELRDIVAAPDGNHKADAVADALARAVTTLPAQLAKSLTWDLGHEMAQHQRFRRHERLVDLVCTKGQIDPSALRPVRRSTTNLDG